MIKDEDLHSSIDYSGGQREAAHSILVELCSLLHNTRTTSVSSVDGSPIYYTQTGDMWGVSMSIC